MSYAYPVELYLCYTTAAAHAFARHGEAVFLFLHFSDLQFRMHAPYCTIDEDNQYADINITIPVVFLLEQTLCGITDWPLEAHQQEREEDFLVSQSPLNSDSIPVRKQKA